MNQHRFDALTHMVTSLPSRRHLLRGLAGAGPGFVLGAVPLSGIAEAKKKRKHKKKDKKRTPNAFGCLDVGDPCTSEEQCCSGICEGKKGKRTCRAHDSGVCGANSDICESGQPSFCGGASDPCLCLLTTGNAPFCGEFAPGVPGETFCQDCSHDADCEAEFGPGAACVVYSGVCADLCPTGTACVPACGGTLGQSRQH